MDGPLIVWAKVVLRLALVLLGVGILPALVARFVFAGFDALIPALLLFTVAPLGVVSLAVALILFLAALVRRRPGGPS